MRVLACGGREYKDDARVWETFQDIGGPDKIDVIIEGGARGADQLASEYAIQYSITNERYPADWEQHGKAAGHIRNKQMLDEGKPDLVIAFPGGRGTANMVMQAEKAGVEVRKIDW